MTRLSLARLTLLLSLCCAWTMPAHAPGQSVAQAPSKPQFFGGIVTQLDASHITISRTPAGKATEHRTFLVTSKTRMSKTVRVRSRVIVRYQRLAEGDVALEVRIRPLMRTPRAS